MKPDTPPPDPSRPIVGLGQTPAVEKMPRGVALLLGGVTLALLGGLSAHFWHRSAPPGTLAQLAQAEPSPAVCTRLAQQIEQNPKGTDAALERQILACVARHFWPYSDKTNPAVLNALQHENARAQQR